jgi:hypothetical protein
MSNYAESKKKIEKIRDWYGEFVFRGGISHLMDVGIRHLTEENVERTCKEIMQSDDSGQFMTNEFKCELVKAAYELAQVSHIDLLVYIQREVAYDVCDYVIGYKRAIELLKRCIEQIEADESYNNTETYDVLQIIGFDDDELEEFGYGYLLEESEEE